MGVRTYSDARYLILGFPSGVFRFTVLFSSPTQGIKTSRSVERPTPLAPPHPSPYLLTTHLHQPTRPPTLHPPSRPPTPSKLSLYPTSCVQEDMRPTSSVKCFRLNFAKDGVTLPECSLLSFRGQQFTKERFWLLCGLYSLLGLRPEGTCTSNIHS